MSKCEYDVVFYRVFCLSLLVIAFIFTVILTNVFVDIDGLLSRKEKTKINHDPELYKESTINLIREEKPEIIFNGAKNYDDVEDAYRKEDVYVNEEDSFRNKRSLEAKSFLLHLQNPTVKGILTNHLNELLKQMDAEEFKIDGIEEKKYIDNNKNEVKLINKDVEGSNIEIKPSNQILELNDTDKILVIKALLEINRTNDNNSAIDEKSKKEILHLAMHDILLQGIISHMDLNEVYRRVNVLNKRYDEDNKFEEMNTKNNQHTLRNHQDNTKNMESKFFDELVQCKELQNEIHNRLQAGRNSRKYDSIKAIDNEKPQMVLKTQIDINDETKHDHILNSREVQGIVKLLYNGKPVKIRLTSSAEMNSVKPIDKLSKSVTEPIELIANENEGMDQESIRLMNDEGETLDSTPVKFNIPQSYLNKALANFFNKHYNTNKNPTEYFKSKRSFNNKRFKRHIKIHYDPKKNKTKSEDDELYVEIETHFDSKGMKGEKRKKMIRNLIEKIENAIHSNAEAQANKTKKHHHTHVKKRVQNPLPYDNTFLFKKISTLTHKKVEHRPLDPISKSVNSNKNDVPKIYDKLGESWKRTYTAPGFLTPSKALNSAEMSEVDVDYNRVLTFNGIPQRLQKPLNTDDSDEVQPTNYYDLGNLNFFVKDMDGSGIAVGFNQYTDEEPDPETIKIFTGVDNLYKVYNHNYVKTPDKDREIEPYDEMTTEIQIKNQAYDKMYDNINNSDMPDHHTIIRRSAVEEDYHSNEYKMIYDTNILPYDSYQEIFESSNKHRKKHFEEPKNISKNIMSDKPATDIFSKKLKPSEIFSLANLLEAYRKKRSLTVKKYSNINTRRKLNKFLQTKSNKLFINKKRLKRHIDKIRIIATDKNQLNRRPHKHSDEQNIFVMSNENEFTNRAVLRAVLRPGEERNEKINDERNAEKIEEAYDYSLNQPDQNYMSRIFEESSPPDETYVTHIFDDRFRHNPLMSKYPHILMEEISKSKESDTDPVDNNFNKNVMTKLDQSRIDQYDIPVPPFDTTTENYYPLVQNVSTLKTSQNLPSTNAKTKYKLSVKIMPQNLSELKAGFKEVHTSINKSFDKDGLRYFSLVNVSEISRVEDINKTKRHGKKKNVANTNIPQTSTMYPHIKTQQAKIKSMLKRHKQMIDLQLAHLKKEKTHLDNILVANQSDSDEVLDLKLPGQSKPLQMKKSDISKILASLLRKSDNEPSTPESPTTTPTTTTPTTTAPTTASTTTSTTTTHAPRPITVKTVDTKLVNIIEKNGKLTKEILNKIDKNTEMLEMFLVKLIDRIDKHETTTAKHIDITNADKKEVKTYPIQEGYIMRRSMDDRNNTIYGVPYTYAYQHPYINPGKPNTANMVYRDGAHPNDVMIDNPKMMMAKAVSKSDILKSDNKGKFFIDNDLGNVYKAIPGPLVQNTGIPANVTTQQ